MINRYPYLCDDPDMDLSPIREKSERLYRDILRERQFYADNPDCQNVHFFHKVRQGDKISFWVDRWGDAVLVSRHGKWSSLRLRIINSPALKKKCSEGYYRISGLMNCGIRDHIYVHILVSDIFLPNTDFILCELDHLNGEHLDNNALNLERVSHEENIRRWRVMHCQRKGLPIPWKYQSLKNYLSFLQNKNQQSTIKNLNQYGSNICQPRMGN